MSSSDESNFYEIVELDSGEVALSSGDPGEDHIISIRFSDKSFMFIDGAKLEIAKAMIEAGLDAISEMSDEESEVLEDDSPIIH